MLAQTQVGLLAHILSAFNLEAAGKNSWCSFQTCNMRCSVVATAVLFYSSGANTVFKMIMLCSATEIWVVRIVYILVVVLWINIEDINSIQTSCRRIHTKACGRKAQAWFRLGVFGQKRSTQQPANSRKKKKQKKKLEGTNKPFTDDFRLEWASCSFR